MVGSRKRTTVTLSSTLPEAFHSHLHFSEITLKSTMKNELEAERKFECELMRPARGFCGSCLIVFMTRMVNLKPMHYSFRKTHQLHKYV